MPWFEMVGGPVDVEGQGRDQPVRQHPAGTGSGRLDADRHQIAGNDDEGSIALPVVRQGCEKVGKIHVGLQI